MFQMDIDCYYIMRRKMESLYNADYFWDEDDRGCTIRKCINCKMKIDGSFSYGFFHEKEKTPAGVECVSVDGFMEELKAL